MNKFIIQILFLIYNCNIVVFPFRSVNNADNIYNNFFEKELYTEISIGSPPQKININININNFNSYIGPNICYKNSISYYNYSNSKYFFLTPSVLEEDGFYQLGDAAYVKEMFSFYNCTDLKNNVTNIILEFLYKNFYSYQKNIEVCGILGLGIKKRNDEPGFESFVSVLKKRKLINCYYWTYIFFNKDRENEPKRIINMPEINNENIIKNYEGMIIIGNYTEIDINNNDYAYEILSSLAAERYKELKWDIIINKIYNKYEKIYFQNNKIFLDLSINYEYIISPEEHFEKIIIPYFRIFLENKKCKLNEIKYDKYTYDIINCDTKLFTEYDIKDFPIIYFYSQDFHFTFELTYNDLFEIRNNDIFFLILKNKNSFEQDLWKMGKIFLNKYHFSFNQDSKTINLHLKYNKNKIEGKVNATDKNKNHFQFNPNYIWIFICIICLIVGIYLGSRFIIKSRKLRANELKDEYEYKESKENNNEKNIFLNEKNIEMGIKNN